MTRFTDPDYPDFWRSDDPQLPAEEMQELIVKDEKSQLSLEVEVIQRALRLVTEERDKLQSQVDSLQGEIQPVKDDNIRLQTRLEENKKRMDDAIQKTLSGADLKSTLIV